MDFVIGIFVLGFFVSFLVAKAIFVAHDFLNEEIGRQEEQSDLSGIPLTQQRSMRFGEMAKVKGAD